MDMDFIGQKLISEITNKTIQLHNIFYHTSLMCKKQQKQKYLAAFSEYVTNSELGWKYFNIFMLYIYTYIFIIKEIIKFLLILL